MTQSALRLDGKTAVVTGGGTGIGRAIAEVFAEAGAWVVVAGRTKRSLTEVAQRIGGTAVACDVTVPAQVDAMFEEARDRTGKVDVLVNNAGVTGPIGNIADVDLQAWRECVEINLFGAVNCLRAAARIMTAQKHGSIINMSSRMGLYGYPMRTAYCATKFALIGITESVAREVGPHGVRVNALCPGAVSGELMDRVIERRAKAENRPAADIIKENYTDAASLKRWVDPREVAMAALYLAADASSAITGDRIKVDCGRT